MQRDINEIDDSGKLEMAFAKIGFDYKSMVNSARFVNNWTIIFSTEFVFRYIQNDNEKIHFSFTVIRSGSNQEYCIHHIRATLLGSISNSNQTNIVIGKNYWNYNQPFPPKEKICDDIALMLIPLQNLKG
jgi:CTP:phosphocholine cytidylyltransferase-like protein